jgi:predicted transcriptional regulator
MSKTIPLSKRERQIMDLIYARGQASISEVLAELPDPPMRGAVRTLLRIMQEKGHLSRRKEGKEFVYRPTQPRTRAARSALGRVLDVFYNGSLEKAVAAHLNDPGSGRSLSPGELQRLADLIENAKQKGV